MAEDNKNKENQNNLITKDMPIGEVVEKYPDTAEVMFRHGMHCIGCHVAAFETVEQGAAAHGIDSDKLIKELNEAAVESKEKNE